MISLPWWARLPFIPGYYWEVSLLIVMAMIGLALWPNASVKWRTAWLLPAAIILAMMPLGTDL